MKKLTKKEQCNAEINKIYEMLTLKMKNYTVTLHNIQKGYFITVNLPNNKNNSIKISIIHELVSIKWKNTSESKSYYQGGYQAISNFEIAMLISQTANYLTKNIYPLTKNVSPEYTTYTLPEFEMV
jgi:hypothetical protein